MIKKRFLFLLCNALLFFAFSCKKECFQIVPVASFEPITDYYPDFKEYCQLDFNNGLFEINAVKASFFGDVKTSIDQADKDARISNDQFVMFDNLNEGQINSFKEKYLKILADSTIEKADSLEAKTILNLLDGPKDVKSTFKNAHLVDAIE